MISIDRPPCETVEDIIEEASDMFNYAILMRLGMERNNIEDEDALFIAKHAMKCAKMFFDGIADILAKQNKQND